MAAGYKEWGPEEAAAAGWGEEEQRIWDELLAGQSQEARDFLEGRGNPAQTATGADQQARGVIRQKILESTRGKKEAEANVGYEWGGRKGAADADSEYFRRAAEGAQNRQGEQINTGRADEWRYATQQDRLQQQQALGLMEQRARGLVPSVAEMQAQRDMGRAVADQSSIAAGARGAAGLALAQQQAAGNSAALTSRISNDAQVNAANERMQAEQAWFGGLSGMRGQDTQSQTVDLQTAQAQAQLNAAQRAQNDSYSMGLYGNEQNVRQAQLASHNNRQAHKLGQMGMAMQAQQNKQQQQQQSSDRTLGMIGTGVMAVGSMFSDVMAKENVQPLIGAGMGGGAMGLGASLAQPTASERMGGMLGGGGAAMAGSSMAIPRAPEQGFNWGQGLSKGLGALGYGMRSWSDEHTKQNAVSLGYAAGLMAQPGDGDPMREAKASAWDEGNGAALADAKKLSAMSGPELKKLADAGHPLAVMVRDMRANAWDEGRASHQQQARQEDPYAALKAQAQGAMSEGEAQHQGLMDRGPAVSDHDAERRRYMSQFEYRWDPETKRHGRNPDFRSDPVTDQFAQGLAPSAYEYKPEFRGGGMGSPGTKVGPMAQNMAANPVTATAVRRDPRTGLLAIDGADGLKVALAAGGSNAAKIQQIEQRLAELQAGAAGQHEGLMRLGPAIGGM